MIRYSWKAMSEGDPENQADITLRDGAQTPARKSIAEILENIPTAPGVYIMKDRRGKVVYIGKAAVLRNRVRQYFQASSGDNRDFVPLLDGIVGEIETVITSNEKEALLLENTLIKKHQPRFNVNLKDDKNFLVLRLDPEAEWPRLEVVRKIGQDGAYYFGPYHSASSCREALRVVNRHFQLRTCTDHVLHNRRRPCLQFQIKRCPAPCVLPVSPEEYGDQVRDVRLFLEGKSDELLSRLGGRMKEAAARTDFERAAEIRDQLRALETTLEEQRVVSTDFVDQDIFGFYREGIALEIVVMSIRQGRLLGNRAFSFTGQEFPDAELLSSFVGLYYDLNVSPPDEVLLPLAIDDAEVKAEWLSEKRPPRRRRVEVAVPQRGDRRKLIELAQKNAAASFAARRDAREDIEVALGKLQRRLKLPRLPRVIECYDISHIQGFATVASMVVFVDGKPEKSRYRTYKVRSVGARSGGEGGVAGAAAGAFVRRNDDFASMYEVLSRRFRRAREGASAKDAGGDGDQSWALPDLIVIDGGKGQLGMALAAARDVGIDVRVGSGLPIVGLAKERDVDVTTDDEEASVAEGATATAAEGATAPTVAEPAVVPDQPAPASSELLPPPAAAPKTDAGKTRRPDRVFLPNAKDAIPIRPNTAEMFILQHLRDEAHRFAVAFHRGQRKRLTLRSALSTIPGIGAGRQRLLLRHFGSLKKIREASLEDLAAVPGVTRKAAQAVYDYWQAQPQSRIAVAAGVAIVGVPGTAGAAGAATALAGGEGSPAVVAVGEDAEEDALASAFAALSADESADADDPNDPAGDPLIEGNEPP
ncbi:MAG: excinuclease subunit [Myxococcales bacterium]|jgi:excinuclease ABC subunit C|nr:excinuclease subunit [Myxococcales bacterium]